VTTTADTVDATVGDGACADASGTCSPRAAVQEANAAPGSDTIRLAPGQTYTLSLAGASEDAAATSTSPRPSCCRVGERDDRRGGPPETESGGAFINTSGTLRVSNASIDGNSATRAGGAIEANAGTTRLDRVRLTNNDTGPTPGNGGGLHLTGTGSVSVSNSSVMGHTASDLALRDRYDGGQQQLGDRQHRQRRGR